MQYSFLLLLLFWEITICPPCGSHFPSSHSITIEPNKSFIVLVIKKKLKRNKCYMDYVGLGMVKSFLPILLCPT